MPVMLTRIFAKRTAPVAIIACLAIVFCGQEYCEAAVFASYDGSRHDRFLADGTPNPNFIIDEADISGLGSNSRAVLITPQHYVTAAHAPTTAPTFRGSDGVTRSYSASSFTTLMTTTGSGAQASDIRIYTLDAPIPTTHGVNPLSVFSDSTTSLQGHELLVIGQGNRAGRNVIEGTTVVTFGGGASPTHTVYYTYDTPTNGGSGGLVLDEAGLIGGDSGHAALIRIGDEVAVLGAHMGISDPTAAANGDFYFSFSSLLTPYLDEIGQIVAADGHSLSTVSMSIVAVPEPSSIVLLAFTGLIIGCRRRRR